MSEEKQSFMEQLDAWSSANVIVPLTKAYGGGNEEHYHVAAANVKKAIREKVLESYRNGKAAGAGVKSQPQGFRPRRQFSK